MVTFDNRHASALPSRLRAAGQGAGELAGAPVEDITGPNAHGREVEGET